MAREQRSIFEWLGKGRTREGGIVKREIAEGQRKSDHNRSEAEIAGGERARK